MAFKESLYVTITEPVIDGVSGMVSHHLMQHTRTDPLVDDCETEVVRELRDCRGQDLDLFVMVASIVGRLHRLLVDLDQAAGTPRPLNLKAGPPEPYKATNELGFQLNQLLAHFAHRADSRA